MRNYLLVFILICLAFSCDKQVREFNTGELIEGFELLSSDKTGITFNNRIEESEEFNHFYFAQIYNGAGVAIGDLNNDDLPDIFFCGNQVDDKLYLNKGNFQFEDITEKAIPLGNDGWSWGVTMADVNADGYLDIYVSRHGLTLIPEERRNKLYINNGDLTFTESAIRYGLADTGHSTQAVFFDMDNDGDLDMYQVNQPADQKLFLNNTFTQSDGKYFRDRLYENQNGKYIDISEKAGISRELSYGLSVNATDFNNDGLIDLYIANDYDQPDAMYYNNGDGTFKDVIHSNLKHISRFSMGSDTGDVNNDGLMDLMTIDMSSEDHFRSKTNMQSMSTELFNEFVAQGKHYQYMENTLQINTGMGSFTNIGNLAGVSRTDWSWSSLIVDLNNNGKKDILVTNGIKKDVLNNDYLTIVRNLDLKISKQDFFEVSKNTPSQPLPNYAFRNNGDFDFNKVSEDWGFDTPSFSSGMAYGDLDNDGDLDVVISNMEQEAFVYKNKTNGNFLKIELSGPENNTFGYGAKAIIHHGENIQTNDNTVTRGYLSSVEPGIFFGLGDDRSVNKAEVIWPDGKINILENVEANKILRVSYSDAEKRAEKNSQNDRMLEMVKSNELGIDYTHEENNFDEYQEEILLPHNVSQNGPFMAVSDVNADGLEDMFIGGASGQSARLFIQLDNNKFELNSSQPWEEHKISEDLEALFLDIDGDGDSDLYVASGGSEFKQGDQRLKDRLYVNDGKGNFSYKENLLPPIYESSQAVKASDIDKDGDLDLFVGTRLIPGKYGFPPSSYLLINNNGKYSIANKEISIDLEELGMVTDAVFTDIDQDGDDDLMIVGEWMEVTILRNDEGVFQNASKEFGLNHSRGIWWSISAGDLDGDGDDDYVLGNLGKNNKFKASKEHPFKVYANDFDENGTNDIVLAKYYKDDYVPVRGRECTSQQMPFVKEKFKDFNSFASSKLLEILPEETVDDAVVYEINSFESVILINNNGTLDRQTLPIQAQFSPLKSSLIKDINGDGINDIIATGNHYGVEIETTRYDGGSGVILVGNGQGGFNYVSPNESGFYTPGDSREIGFLNSKGTPLIFVTNNNSELSIFQLD